MATDQERLVVSLEARIRDFEKNFQKANRTANDNFGRIEKRAKQSGDRMEKTMSASASRVGSALKSFGVGFAGGIIGGLTVGGLTQIASRLGQVAEGVANIGSSAKRAGIDVKSFQELAYVAEQNRISVDTLTDGIKELNLRADEFIVTGSGSGAEAFKRLGFGAAELREKLKDPSALLVEIIGRLQRLDRAAQIRISDELFGGSAGERFVELLDQGADGIRGMIQEANDFGLVLDKDVIARADEIDRKFKLITATIGTGMKAAIVEAAGALLDFWDGLNRIEEQQSRLLSARLDKSGKARIALEERIRKIREGQDSPLPGMDRAGSIAHLESRLSALQGTEARIVETLGSRAEKPVITPQTPPVTPRPPTTGSGRGRTGRAPMNYDEAMRALKSEIPELAEQLALLDARSRIETAHRRALQTATTPEARAEAGGLRDQALAAVDPAQKAAMQQQTERTDAARQQAESYAVIIASAHEYTAAQNIERQALDMTTVGAQTLRYEHDLLAQAQRSGIEVTAAQRAEIQQLAQGMATAEQAVTQYAETQQQAAEVSAYFGQQAVGALSGILTGTMTLQGALTGLLDTLMKAVIQAALLGEGPLAGLFGGAAGGGKGGGKAGGILGGLLNIGMSFLGGGGFIPAPTTPGPSNFGFGGLYADGGHVRGPGTSRSDSIPAMLSDGEFVVNAKSTKRHRAALEAINSGKAPAFASGGIVGGHNLSNTYAPNLNINVAGGAGNDAQNGSLARTIAREVNRVLADQRPDSSRKTAGQQLTQLASAMQRASSRNG